MVDQFGQPTCHEFWLTIPFGLTTGRLARRRWTWGTIHRVEPSFVHLVSESQVRRIVDVRDLEGKVDLRDETDALAYVRLTSSPATERCFVYARTGVSLLPAGLGVLAVRFYPQGSSGAEPLRFIARRGRGEACTRLEVIAREELDLAYTMGQSQLLQYLRGAPEGSLGVIRKSTMRGLGLRHAECRREPGGFIIRRDVVEFAGPREVASVYRVCEAVGPTGEYKVLAWQSLPSALGSAVRWGTNRNADPWTSIR